MTDLDLATVPRVTLVFNGPLRMSPGKMAAQAFQACQRLYAAPEELGGFDLHQQRRRLLRDWERHTTTIARVAKTTAMFDRVCREVPGVVMVDEGFTEVDPDTPTVFASWPATPAEEHRLLGNAKVKLLHERLEPFAVWSDEQLAALAEALEAAHAGGKFEDGAIADALRAEASSRHVQLTGGAPETWLAR